MSLFSGGSWRILFPVYCSTSSTFFDYPHFCVGPALNFHFFFFETIERNNDRRNNSNNPKSLGISWKIGNQANDATRHTHTHTNNKRELKLQGMEGGSLELGNFSLCWCIPFTKRGYLFYLVSYLDDVRPRVNYNEEENPFNVPGSSFILSFYFLNSLLIIFSPVFRSTTI